ncbi:MAG: ACT domain-containing protein [Sphingobacteriales bacterium]
MSQLRFVVLPGTYSLCRLSPIEKIPGWIFNSSFYTVSKTPDELSVVCETEFVPADIKKNTGWKMLRIDAVLDLSLTGITAKFSAPLAEAGVNLCVIATYDTDYVMIQEEKLAIARTALNNAGFIVE